jgi:hypothetical protein
MSAVTLDPSGELYGLPSYPWRCAPAGLATRRQLGQLGLRPGGREPVAQIMRTRRRRPPMVGYLYPIAGSPAKRPMTPGRSRALAAALRARQTCPECSRWVAYVIPAHLGECLDCAAARTRSTQEAQRCPA